MSTPIYIMPILIVEDEPDGQELMTRLLSQVNLPVATCADAEIAWQRLNGGEYTAVIIDLALPGKDGFELLAQIRHSETLANLPCIAITAFHTPELRQRAMIEGFNAYFAKPLDRTRFLNALERVLTAH